MWQEFISLASKSRINDMPAHGLLFSFFTVLFPKTFVEKLSDLEVTDEFKIWKLSDWSPLASREALSC